jgi:hypothetical protein
LARCRISRQGRARIALGRRQRLALQKHNTLQDFPRSMSFVLRVRPNQMILMILLVGGPIAMRSLFVAALLTIIAAVTITVLTTRPHAMAASCKLSYCSGADAE